MELQTYVTKALRNNTKLMGKTNAILFSLGGLT